MTTLKIGSTILHTGKHSQRKGSIGVVMDAPLLEGAGKAKYVVCWFSGPTIIPGHTTMALYTSYWLEDNSMVLAEPREDNDESQAAKVYFSKKGCELRKASAAQGPFMVCVEGAGAPKKEHDSLTMANLEAERLSANNPGRKVRVLSVVNAVKTVTSTTTTWDK